MSINPWQGVLVDQNRNRGGEITKRLSVYFPRHAFSLQMKTDSVWGFSVSDTFFYRWFGIVGVGCFLPGRTQLEGILFCPHCWSSLSEIIIIKNYHHHQHHQQQQQQHHHNAGALLGLVQWQETHGDKLSGWETYCLGKNHDFNHYHHLEIVF